jgi:hypothetical protein
VRRSFWPTHVRRAAAATAAVQTGPDTQKQYLDMIELELKPSCIQITIRTLKLQTIRYIYRYNK